MLVYGSPSRAWASRDLTEQLYKRVHTLRRRIAPLLRSELRALLIYTGQLEQGLSDALLADEASPVSPEVGLSRHVTAGAAMALYHGNTRALASCEVALKLL